MSCKAITWAWLQKVNSTQKIVLVALADHCDNDGWCWPAHETLATKCSMSRRSVVRAISQLKEQRKISVRSRKDNKGYQTSNLYKLDLEDKTQSDRLALGKEKENEDAPRVSDDGGLGEVAGDDNSQSDSLALGDESEQKQPVQSDSQDAQSDNGGNPRVTNGASQSDTVSHKPSVNHHKNHHLTGGSGGDGNFKNIPKSVEDWKPVLKNLGFDEDKINSPQSIEMISEWVNQQITIGEVHLGYDKACEKASGGKPLFPRFIRNFVVIVRKDKLWNGGGTASGGPRALEIWETQGFETEEAWEQHGHDLQLKKNEALKELAQQRKKSKNQ